jgi:NADH-quinone oxidoreductase subunit J
MLAFEFVNFATFFIATAICVVSAVGVVAFRNTVHNALSLVATLFGIAVLFLLQEAYFLAAMQVIVYAGAVVVLFLFVIMLLGVDTVESFVSERRPAVIAAGAVLGGLTAGLVTLALRAGDVTTGQKAALAPLDAKNDINVIGDALFTKYVFAFEITSVLLIIAVVGAFMLSRRGGEAIDLDEFPEPTVDVSDEVAEVEQ